MDTLYSTIPFRNAKAFVSVNHACGSQHCQRAKEAFETVKRALNEYDRTILPWLRTDFTVTIDISEARTTTIQVLPRRMNAQAEAAAERVETYCAAALLPIQGKHCEPTPPDQAKNHRVTGLLSVGKALLSLEIKHRCSDTCNDTCFVARSVLQAVENRLDKRRPWRKLVMWVKSFDRRDETIFINISLETHTRVGSMIQAGPFPDDLREEVNIAIQSYRGMPRR